jgi:hypothetical protein
MTVEEVSTMKSSEFFAWVDFLSAPARKREKQKMENFRTSLKGALGGAKG